MSSLPPPHPSLPLPPQPSSSNRNTYYPVTSYPAYYNSHYVQAYSQSPAAPYSTQLYPAQASMTNSNYASQSAHTGPARHFTPRPIWYEPGNNRCTHPGCTFSGSAKTVEIHMMDRHLIYPPGWEKRKKKSEWDADPSLKGKPIPIQGTNVILDTPEVLAAWIAERKRRFPTANRVEDKKRKLQEAAERGQLDIIDSSHFNKRPKTEPSSHHFNRDDTRHDSRPTQHHKSRGRQDDRHNRKQDSGWPRKAKNDDRVVESAKSIPVESVATDSGSVSDDDDDDDGAPESLSSKVVPQTAPSVDQDAEATVKESTRSALPVGSTKGMNGKKPLLEPKLPPKNPFGSRPTLLRNLLLPEIRVTVSNLSQAIRFIVDNDFLRDVELKPGQAAESNKIRVVELDQDSTKT
ncbi:hypothetical protein JR316_0000916 [Psilocybe cubensis]|uniref:FMR1-interacting protein 1 conserved domain-containing protein n=2 Tax=Psilocybe cubensis TaxID=181762 RepID=A0A8H8CQT1_PSICU|nr:hypothetical protein JR316_0000916 [Psilocybe cubensis]KAH9486851.1 hypothetical protein JR316_0000916 [Psilocybe cubensis]